MSIINNSEDGTGPLRTSAASSATVWAKPLSWWTRFALFWMMSITVTGAAVRLTGSGLGCTDWPTCSVNTELEAPGFHSAIEFGNRMISGLAIIPVFAAFLGARKHRRDLLPVIYVTVLGFLGQVILGMLVTRTELDPRVVLGHFLLSIVLIFLSVMLDYRARNPRLTTSIRESAIDYPRRRILSRAMFLAATAVIIAGTFVTGSGPHTGSEASGEPIPRLGFDITEITRVHSVLGWVLVALIVYGMWQTRKPNNEWGSTDQMWLGRIGTVALLQGALGYLQFSIGVPVGLVALHITGAVLLWTLISWYAMVASDPVVELASDRQPTLVS